MHNLQACGANPDHYTWEGMHLEDSDLYPSYTDSDHKIFKERRTLVSLIKCRKDCDQGRPYSHLEGFKNVSGRDDTLSNIEKVGASLNDLQQLSFKEPIPKSKQGDDSLNIPAGRLADSLKRLCKEESSDPLIRLSRAGICLPERASGNWLSCTDGNAKGFLLSTAQQVNNLNAGDDESVNLNEDLESISDHSSTTKTLQSIDELELDGEKACRNSNKLVCLELFALAAFLC